MSNPSLTGDQILQALFDPNSNSIKTAGSQDSIKVSNFPVLQAVSSAGCSTATITNSPTITTVSQIVIAANPNRKGLILYNNSANSVYFSFVYPGNSNTLCTMILATFTQFIMPQPIYTGVISGIRNAGTGFIVCTELT